MAAAGLRLSTLNLTNAYVNMSLTLLSAASNNVNSTGYLTQVTNPNSFSVQGTVSPEGQSFVILAYSAYNQWAAQGSPGNTGPGLGATSRAEKVGASLFAVGSGLLGSLLWWSVVV